MTDTPASRRDHLAIAFALVFPTLLTWVYFVALAKSAPGLQQAASVIGKLIQFGFPVYWVFVVQRQRLSRPPFKRDGLWVGGLLGLAIVATIFAAYHLWLKPSGAFDAPAAAIREKVVGLGINAAWKFVALSAFYVVIHSLLEEYYWRWFVFAQLRRAMSFGPAIVLSSIGFMAHHVVVLSHFFGWGSFLSLFFSTGVAVGGVLWAWLYHRTSSLSGPWLSHCLVDAGIFAIGYQLLQLSR